LLKYSHITAEMSSDISLSKLSRGKGEKVGQNIQVVYDDQVKIENLN